MQCSVSKSLDKVDVTEVYSPPRVVAEAQRRGAHIDAVQPLRATLESLFVETSQTPTDAKDPPAGASAEP